LPIADCRLPIARFLVPATGAEALSIRDRFISNCRLPDFLRLLPVPKVFQSAIGNRQLAIPYIASP
jgi:hypothetical protein